MITIKTNDFDDLIKKRKIEMYFCLDQSGSMHNEMDMVKQAIEWLY